MTPTDLADILDAIAKQPAVPLRDIRGELRQAAQMLREMAEALAKIAALPGLRGDSEYSQGSDDGRQEAAAIALAALGSQP